MQSTPRKRWVPFVVINLLIFFFGASYAWFPMGTVEADGNQTTGLLHIGRGLWGAYLMLSALAMLLVAVTGYRRRASWAWWALGYEILFLVAVAVIEPDPVVPTIFGLVLGYALWRTRDLARGAEAAAPAPA